MVGDGWRLYLKSMYDDIISSYDQVENTTTQMSSLPDMLEEAKLLQNNIIIIIVMNIQPKFVIIQNLQLNLYIAKGMFSKTI